MSDSSKKRPKKPSKTKPVADLTDDEVMRRLFPKTVREEIKREAQESDRKAGKKGPGGHDDPS